MILRRLIERQLPVPLWVIAAGVVAFAVLVLALLLAILFKKR